MTVPDLRLGETSWAELTDLARQRIPDASLGRWTLHAPVDPGVTILELMAWLLEQRLFMLDQIPDTLVAALLRLLGLGGPLPAVPATTVLAFAAHERPLLVPTGTEVTRVVDGDRIVLSTEAALTAWPALRLNRVVVDGQARPVQPDDAEPVLLTGDTTFEFEHASGGPVTGGPLSLYVDVGDASRSELGWFQGSDITVAGADTERHEPVAAPCRFEWFVDRGAGPTPVQVTDGTEGWRHPGILQVDVPSIGGSRLSIVSRCTDDRPTIPSRLRAVVANATVARHRRYRVVDSDTADPRAEETAEVIAGWLPLPGQELPLPDAAGQRGQALDRLVDDPSRTGVELLERDGVRHEWTVVGDLGIHRRDERVVEVDRDAGLLRFGDGIHGRVPRPASGSRGFRVSYALGAGAIPEVGPNLAWVTTTAGLEAANVVSLDGGRDPEDMTEARARAATALGRHCRAVVSRDVEAIVRSQPGLRFARVHVAPGVDRRHPGVVVDDAVSVFCVPAAPRVRPRDRDDVPFPEPDPPSLEAVRDALERARLVGTFFYVEPPAYRTVDLRVVLAADRAIDADGRDALIEGLRAFLDPLTGWLTAEGWPFGLPLRPADLIAPAQAALDSEAEVIGVVVGLDGHRPDEDCAQVDIRPYELPKLHTVAVSMARS